MAITKTLVTKSNLDSLADSISTKSGVSTPMTVVQMKTAVDNINTHGNLEDNKTVSPQISTQIVTPSSGYDGLKQVTVNGMTAMSLPSGTSTSSSGTLIGSAIGRSTGTRYINIPTGYNDTARYYQISAVANGSATTPARTITASTSISANNGNITATVSGSSSITPTVSAGYVSSGTAGTVSVSGTTTVSATSLDSNLLAGNILSGKTIFGVSGSVTFATIYSGSSTPSSSLGLNGDIYIQS